NGVQFTVNQPAPVISGVAPNPAAIGQSVTISGSNFGASQGVSTVTFNGTLATPTPGTWSSTSIAVPVPNGATSGPVVVTVGGTPSSGFAFTVTNPGPSISTINPSSGSVGQAVTISGSNFGALQGSSTVMFNGTLATPTPGTWTNTSIAVPVPNGATTGPVVVTVGGVASNGVSFTVTAPPATISLVQHASVDAGSGITTTT